MVDPESDRQQRAELLLTWQRFLVLLLGFASVIASWYFVDDGTSWLFLAVAAAWTVWPWLALAGTLGLMPIWARLAAVAGYVALTAVMYSGVDDSSTGAIGLLFLPLLLAALLGAVLVAGAAARGLSALLRSG